MLLEKKRSDDGRNVLPGLLRDHMLGYAETFMELSKSFDTEFIYEGENRQCMLEAKNIWENRKLMGNSLARVSGIMEGIAGQMCDIQRIPPKKRRRLEQALKTEGIFLEEMGLIASEERDRDRYCAILSTKGPGEIRANKAAKVMSALFHESYQVSAGSPEYIGSTRKLFTFVKKTGRMALTGYARAVKEGEKVSGDNYSFWESEDGRLTAILSDGTGSGEKACEKSGEVLELMEKMLEVGMKVEAAVDLLNSSCFPGMEGWNHPTLDICDVNLYTGEAYFYKVGGAASFLRTKEGVEVIRGGMLPVGFLSDLHLCHLKKTLRNGDYLVMVSDGVVDAFGEAAYEEGVRKALEEIKEDHPKALAEELIRQAICAQGGHIPDDMTVLVLGIFEKNNP